MIKNRKLVFMVLAIIIMTAFPVFSTDGLSSDNSLGLYDSQGGYFQLLVDGEVMFERYGPKDGDWIGLTGDWNGDGNYTPGLYDPAGGNFHLMGEEGHVSFGDPNLSPLAGDWNGDGSYGVGVYDQAEGKFYLDCMEIIEGRFGDKGNDLIPVVVSDGEGANTVALYDSEDGFFHPYGGTPFRFGPKGENWTPVTGDWNGDGEYGVGLFYDGHFHVDIENWVSAEWRYGPMGETSWTPVTGNWVADEVIEETIFDEAGTYGPDDEGDAETIEGDVIVKADGVTLQNYIITGDLIIAEEVGDGDVTLNNLEVQGELIICGGGSDSIYVNGGQYSKIRIEEVGGQVRVVAVGVIGDDGKPVDVVIADAAAGEEIFLEGDFDEVTVDAEGVTVNLSAGSSVATMNVNVSAYIKGDGTVNKANVNADDVYFDNEPGEWKKGDDVEVDPVFGEPDAPSTPPGPDPGPVPIPVSAITFTVTDGTDNIEDAEISINGNTIKTDVSGEATIDLEDGTYAYSVSAAGFEAITDGEVVVDGDDVAEAVTMTKTLLENMRVNVTRFYGYYFYEAEGTNRTDQSITIEVQIGTTSKTTTAGPKETFLVQIALTDVQGRDINVAHFFASYQDIQQDMEVPIN